MNIDNTTMIRMLHDSKIRPSVHRLAVLDYVANSGTHPTADDIYAEISKDYPAVSRTTVYNSLHTLVDGGILKELEIDNGSAHYDFARQSPHSHFKCRNCGRIFDMALPAGIAEVVSPGFRVDAAELCFAGVCPECIDRNKNSNN
jgi:Fe2+ or Zn2+ uptake regulation protein